MVEIVEKSRCTGCSACQGVCPRHAISLKAGRMGLLYPTINGDLCIDCGLCQEVCPALHPAEKGSEPKVWAAKHLDDEVRLKSSSGGLFSALAEEVIGRGGVVCGAAYNSEFEVEHRLIERSEELPELRGSKYSQSRMGESFRQIKEVLSKGREVLFVGTPCQVAGLKRYLRGHDQGLLTVDIICHGAPAPQVLNDYLRSITPDGKRITSVNMRDKRSGWIRSRLRIEGERGEVILDERSSKNRYMQGFLQDLFLRPSCHQCPAKGEGRALSDITLGDYWGIGHHHPSFADPKGVSLVLIHTPKGEELFERLPIERIPSTWDRAIERNPGLIHSAKENPQSEAFAHLLEKRGIEEALQLVKIKESPLRRLLLRIKKRFSN
uniref:Coenzyme F420 hydrogenase/dehydrogenase, beta subunit C-terminal domain n=1 Tax=Alistipes sp. TaxID=1872444 RepID=UPI004056DF2E